MSKKELEAKIKALEEIIQLLIEEREDYNYLNFCLMMDDYDCIVNKLVKGDN